MRTYELYQHYRPETLKDLLDHCADAFPDRTAFAWSDRKKEYSITYEAFRDQVYAAAAWIRNRGYVHKHIAVLGENSYEWILVHFAATCSGNVIVPIDRELQAGKVEILLKQSDCDALFCSDTYDDIAAQAASMKLQVFSMSRLKEMTEQGKGLISAGQEDPSSWRPEKSDLASIVFTSGTTGSSKGVMLTHGNLASDTYGSCCSVMLEGPGLLVLPLHHAFGLVAGVFAEMLYGCTVCLNSSLKNLMRDMHRYQPCHMFIVPLMAEQFCRRIRKERKKEKKLRCLIRLSDLLMRFGIDIRYRAFRRIHEVFGGKLKLLVSGGAAIDEHLVRDLSSFGFQVLNGYGITECGPVVAVNRNDHSVPGSVGLPLVCNTVRIEEGEILVRGENVMAGYYKMPNETKAVLSDGWFRTGDLGMIDRFGALHITGRKKNLIILKNGENIPAEYLESRLQGIPGAAEVIVYARNDVITAELYPDPACTDISRIRDEIRKINATLPQKMNIVDLIIRDTPFPKTTTQKIIRDRRP